MLFDGKGTDKIGKNVDNDQLYFYTLLYYFQFKKLPDQIGFYYFHLDTFTPVTLTEDLLNEFRAHGNALEDSLRAQVLNAGGIRRADLLAAWDAAAACRPQFDEIADRFDAVLTPSTPSVAPVGLQNTGDLVFNGLWTLLHVPCVNVPGFQGLGDEAHLPLGLTVTGPRFADRRVLAVAQAIGQLFALRKPAPADDGEAAAGS